MDTCLIGVLIPFMFGWFGPVRPGALISLCHPGYQVPSFSVHRAAVMCHCILCQTSPSCVVLQGPCIFRDCRQPASCSGNRFYFEDGVLHVVWVRTILVCSQPKLWTGPITLCSGSECLSMAVVRIFHISGF